MLYKRKITVAVILIYEYEYVPMGKTHVILTKVFINFIVFGFLSDLVKMTHHNTNDVSM
jgi:hypothetical protein